MADDNSNDPTAPPVTPAPATPAAPVITPEIQALIDRAAQAAHNNAWKQARETYEKPRPTTQTKTTEAAPANPAPAVDAMAILKLRDDFDDAVSDLTLTGSQKRVIRELVMDKRPSDVGGFVRQFTESLGLGKPSTPPGGTPPTGAAAPAAPITTPSTPVTGAPPSNPGELTDDVPILRLSEADRAALIKRIGIKAFTDKMFKEFREHGTRVTLRR